MRRRSSARCSGWDRRASRRAPRGPRSRAPAGDRAARDRDRRRAGRVGATEPWTTAAPRADASGDGRHGLVPPALPARRDAAASARPAPRSATAGGGSVSGSRCTVARSRSSESALSTGSQRSSTGPGPVMTVGAQPISGRWRASCRLRCTPAPPVGGKRWASIRTSRVSRSMTVMTRRGPSGRGGRPPTLAARSRRRRARRQRTGLEHDGAIEPGAGAQRVHGGDRGGAPGTSRGPPARAARAGTRAGRGRAARGRRSSRCRFSSMNLNLTSRNVWIRSTPWM